MCFSEGRLGHEVGDCFIVVGVVQWSREFIYGLLPAFLMEHDSFKLMALDVQTRELTQI